MIKKYNKLVRDRIPEIISGKGGAAKTQVLSDDLEYLTELNKKLQEEVAEYLAAEPDQAIEELADIVEVIEALLKTKNASLADLLKVKAAKAVKRGGFERRIFLESVEEEK